MTRNQHCQHFEPSLVQGRVAISPTPQPPALLTPTTDKQPAGRGTAADAGMHPRLTDPHRDRGRLGPHCGTVALVLPRRVSALLLRCAGTRRRSHPRGRMLSLSLQSHESSQSFAGLAQEGCCRETGKFHWSTIAF